MGADGDAAAESGGIVGGGDVYAVYAGRVKRLAMETAPAPGATYTTDAICRSGMWDTRRAMGFLVARRSG
jgi:hypothetical protein